MRTLVAGFALAMILRPVAAQEPGAAAEPFGPSAISGLWHARWASAVRDEGDSVSVQRYADAMLTLAIDGDTVSGQWDVPEFGGHTWVVSGRLVGGRLTMRADETTEGPLPADGNARLILLEWVASASSDGQQLEGQQWLTLDTPRGRLRSAPRPWTARKRTEGGVTARLSPPPHLPTRARVPDAVRSAPGTPSTQRYRSPGRSPRRSTR